MFYICLIRIYFLFVRGGTTRIIANEMPMQNTSDELKYRKEHLMCENYISDERALWGVFELKAGKHFVREGVKRPTLVFVLEGEISVSTGMAINRKVVAGKMFLIPPGDNFYVRALADAVFMRCSFMRDIALCNRFSIEQLQNYVRPAVSSRSGLTLLPIHHLLAGELAITRNVLHTGLSCIHFQHIKTEILFMELRGFYAKEDLADLFAPILGEDNDFKSKVMQSYSQVSTVKELIDLLNMSSTGFKRKFHDVFGVPAKQWLIQKKKEKLLRDIMMTNMTMAELAEKYNFTVNYLTAFCKEHFGKSPTELRLDA